jgi:tetratricopeptide (TPR) repeat protein
MYRAYGRKAEAVALAEQVRDGRVMTLGAYHPYTLYTMNNLGHAYLAAGNPEKALALFEQAAAGIERIGFIHVAAGRIVTDLCNCLEEQEQTKRADFWRRKWREAVRKRDGPDSAAYGIELAQQGEDIIRHGRYNDAEPILVECLAILRQKQPESPTTFLARSLLGDVLLAQQKYPRAEPLLVQGYEGLKARKGQISPLYAQFRIGEAGERIVRLYEAWGQPEKAAEWRAKLTKPVHAKPKS